MNNAKQDDLKDFKHQEEKRTIQILFSFGIVASLTLITMSVLTFIEGEYTFVFVTVFFALLLIIAILHLYFYKKKAIIIHIYGLVMVMLTISLISTGGVDGNGHLWLFIFPPLIYFLQGTKSGTITLSVIFIIILCYFFVPDMPMREFEYETKFKMRFLIALTAESLISFFAEFSRNTLMKKMIELSERLKFLSRTDELTKILNRRGGLESLQYIKTMAARNKTPFSVIIFDIDHFKAINDNYGHDIGDKMLCEIVARVKDGIRAQDILCRWGGEEFFLVLPQTTRKGLKIIGERLRTLVCEKPYIIHENDIKGSCSFGCAEYKGAEDIDQLLKRADQSLYKAKAMGRNRVIISDLEEDGEH